MWVGPELTGTNSVSPLEAEVKLLRGGGGPILLSLRSLVSFLQTKKTPQVLPFTQGGVSADVICNSKRSLAFNVTHFQGSNVKSIV